jgi:hypothetical protein
MPKHRSLSTALLTPEKMAFIKGEEASDAKSVADPQPFIQSNPPVIPVVELPPEIPSAELKSSQKSSIHQTRSKPSDVPPSRAATPASEDYLVAITTRLQARTAEALRRAYLEQKLNRRNPATQQEIIEIALQHWLRKNSYLV